MVDFGIGLAVEEDGVAAARARLGEVRSLDGSFACLVFVVNPVLLVVKLASDFVGLEFLWLG
jgi:hypothetical protein